MEITVAGLGDLTLGAGTHLSDVIDFAVQHGLTPHREWWCGDQQLGPDHPAGVPPLVHGAHLTATRGPITWTPAGRYLAAMAGPDAGTVVELGHRAVTVGRTAEVAVQDPSMSARHFAVNSAGDTATDLSSTNGTWTTWWPRRKHRLTPGVELRTGHTVWRVNPPESPPQQRDPEQLTPQRLAAVATSAVAGLMMATLTQSLLFVALGLVLPARALAPYLAARRAQRHGDPDWNWDPTGASEWDRPPEGPIAITGPPEKARGFARAVIVARRTACPEWDEDWARWLPSGDRIAVVPQGAHAPSWATMVADVGPVTTRVVSGSRTATVATALLSAHQADAAARRIAHATGGRELTSHVRWGDLERVAGAFGSRHLRVPLGVDANGTHTIDLGHERPHLLIAGARGSGKSTLLESIALALAYDHGPRDLQLMVIDCAEGSGPRRLDDLPHLTALVRRPGHDQVRELLDLLERAVTARTTALHDGPHARFADWEDSSSAPPRVLVVIDDFHHLLRVDRGAHDALVRLASRAHNVGIHLVLSTGHPAGAVSSAIRATMATTIALRVDSPSHSTALIGTDHGALISPRHPGRAVVCRSSSRTEVQVALPLVDHTPLVRMVGDTSTEGSTELSARVQTRWNEVPSSPGALDAGGPRDTTPSSDA